MLATRDRNERKLICSTPNNNIARKSKLAADGFASRQDLDQATAAVATARAKLAECAGGLPSRASRADREELAIADAKLENAEAAVARYRRPRR